MNAETHQILILLLSGVSALLMFCVAILLGVMSYILKQLVQTVRDLCDRVLIIETALKSDTDFAKKLGHLGTVIALAALLALTACGALVPSKRSDSAGVKSSEAISAKHDFSLEAIIGALAPSLATNGGVVRIESKAVQDAASNVTARGSSARSIPFGVNLILIGAGLGLLLVVVTLWRRSSAAAAAAYNAGDEALAAGVRFVRQKVAEGLNHHEIISALETERGKLAARRR